MSSRVRAEGCSAVHLRRWAAGSRLEPSPLDRRGRRSAHHPRMRSEPSAAIADASSAARAAGVVHGDRVLPGTDDGGWNEGGRGRGGGRPACVAARHSDPAGGPRRSIQRRLHGHGHRAESSWPSTRSVSSRLCRSRAVRPSDRPGLDRALICQPRVPWQPSRNPTDGRAGADLLLKSLAVVTLSSDIP